MGHPRLEKNNNTKWNGWTVEVMAGDRPVWQIPLTGNEATSFGGLLIFPLVESNSDKTKDQKGTESISIRAGRAGSAIRSSLYLQALITRHVQI
jgi:hypothetical protein